MMTKAKILQNHLGQKSSGAELSSSQLRLFFASALIKSSLRLHAWTCRNSRGFFLQFPDVIMKTSQIV